MGQDPRSLMFGTTLKPSQLEDKLLYYVAYNTIKEWGDIEREQHPMLAYATSADPDTMY
jgi:hypothetical protein